MLSLRILILAGLLLPITASAQAVKMKLGTVAPQGSPWTESLGAMKKMVKKESEGTLRVKIFPSAQLGDEIQMVEGVQFGTLECAGVSTASIANTVPGMQVFELPFLWESREQAYYIIDNHFRDFFDKKLQAKGMKLIGWSENGWRHFFTKDKPINSPEDLKGLKFRSQESKVHLAFWKALNSTAIPLAMPDVYSALERGMIDGGENTLVLMSATGWAEIVKEVTMTGHIYQPAVLACNKGWYDKLPQKAKDALQKSMTVAEQDMRSRLLEAEKALVDTFRNDFKINVIVPTAAQINAFRKLTQGVKNDPKIKELIGADTYKVLEAGLKAYKNK